MGRERWKQLWLQQQSPSWCVLRKHTTKSPKWIIKEVKPWQHLTQVSNIRISRTGQNDRISESLRLELTSKITKAQIQSTPTAHIPQVPHLCCSGTPPWTVTPPLSGQLCHPIIVLSENNFFSSIQLELPLVQFGPCRSLSGMWNPPCLEPAPQVLFSFYRFSVPRAEIDVLCLVTQVQTLSLSTCQMICLAAASHTWKSIDVT